jgi:hypothetical protein
MKTIMRYLGMGLILCGWAATPARAETANSDLPATVREEKKSDGTIVLDIQVNRPRASEQLARDEALLEAQNAISDYYGRRPNPVVYKPTLEWIEKKLVRDIKIQTVDFQENTDSSLGKFYLARATIELPVYLEASFRKSARIQHGLYGVAGMTGVFLVLAGFFRVDEWTKGFLTTWLVVGAAGLISLFGFLFLLA